MSRRFRYAAFAVVIAFVVLGHVGLWLSDEVPLEAKRRLTLLNALGWGVIVLPAIGVSFWLKAHQRRNRE